MIFGIAFVRMVANHLNNKNANQKNMHRKSIIRLMMIISVVMLVVSSLSAQHRPRRIRRPGLVKPAPANGVRVSNDFENDQYLVGAHF